MDFENDEMDVPFDEDNYEYADEDENLRGKMFIDDDDEDEDDDDMDDNDEIMIYREENTRKNPNRVQRDQSQASDADENNLIDYVIEEEKEIGGTKGEDDSQSVSRSTTYSSLISNDGDDNAEVPIYVESSDEKVKLTTKQQGQMIRARAFLNRLDKKVEEKDDVVKRIRESIYLTKEKITKLEHNKTRLENEVDRAQDQRNPTTVNRLTGELTRAIRELGLERDVLADFQRKLEEAEIDRTKATVERARYNQEETALNQTEELYQKQKRTNAQLRQRQEDWKVTQMKRAHLSALKNQKDSLEQQATAQRSAVDQAKKSQKVAKRYLQKTLEKVRSEKLQEEEVSRVENEKKIQGLLNLRNAIERNKDTMSIQLAEKRAQEQENFIAQKRERDMVENEGQNALFYMLRKEKNEKLAEMQKRFAEEQEKNRLAIVEKILKEENEAERKRRLYPEMFKSPKTKLTLKKTSRTESTSETSHSQSETISEIQQAVTSSQLDIDPGEYASSMTSAFQHEEFDDEIDVDLARPEFDGRWDKQPVKQELDPIFNRSKHWKTKTDKEIFQRTLTKLRENIVREQVVGTKRFEGPVPFKSDPTVILFKDFDVDQVYRSRVTLTNVTLTINTLKLVDLSESLKDFITLKFDPPGMISAGMSCFLHVTFEPKINENLQGEIKFLAQTGMFTVPIRCEIKKVELSLDKTTVPFGSTVVDERLFQSVTLKNSGALGTNYRLVKTNVLRSEQKVKTENKENDASVPSGASSQNRTTPFSEMSELAEKDSFEVFINKSQESGFLGPQSSVTFSFEFSSSIAGNFHEEYSLIFDSNIPTLSFVLTGQSLDVPVWIENPTIDFKICMFDRLYQDALVLRNRSSAALRVSVDIQPKSLQQHIEIVPRTAYIQAKSSFSLQVKLTAHPSIVNDGLSTEIYDPQCNTLIIPLEVKVADQIRTVPFNISAVLTSSDLQFDVEQIDFGCCTVTESVFTTIKLTNHSLLAQPFGFINLPEFIQVQPNDGFGTLLPEETIDLHVLFSPSMAKEYRSTLICKSLVNREFSIECQGVGVLSPLSLSSTVINLPATPINDQSIAVFYVENRHLDKNQFKHPVPRIGNDDFAPVGPTSFHFDVPADAPISLSPVVGTVQPGMRQKITVRFAPKIGQEAIQAEVSRMKDAESKKPVDNKETAKQEAKTKQTNVQNQNRRADQQTVPGNDHDRLTPPEKTIDFSLAQSSLIKSFPASLSSFLIPCYVACGPCSKPGALNYDVANTLFVEIHCPIVRPEMMVVSDYGQTTIDFGSASIGQELSRTVMLKNISSKPIQLHGSLLNIDGPFKLINALRRVGPGETTSIKLAFTPKSTSEFLETFELTTDSSKLTLCLKGSGLKPNVQLSFDPATPFWMGCLFARERIEKTFQIINQSETQVTFRVDIASQHMNRRYEQDNKNVWNPIYDKNQHLIGPQNLSGKTVFDISPIDGFIPAGTRKQLTVTFSPDHDSDYFSDFVQITVSDQPTKLEFRLRGAGRQNTMYIKPLDNPTVLQKSLLPNISDALTLQMQTTDPTEKGVPTNILVLLPVEYDNGKYTMAQRDLTIGCALVTSGSKKNGDYTFDNLKDINAEGFNVDVPKSSVENGGEKSVKITWTPNPTFDPANTCRATINVTTKGDIVRLWRLILIGYVEAVPSNEKQGTRLSKLNRTTGQDTNSQASQSKLRDRTSKQSSLNENKQTTFN